MSETTTPQSVTPAEFDFEAWLAGAHKPTRSVKVYQRGDLIAELDRIADRINVAEEVPAGERSLEDPSPAKLRTQYAETAERFHASALELKVTGHTIDEQKELSADLEKEGEDDAGHTAITFRLLSHAVEPKLSEGQLKALHRTVGEGQFSRITRAYRLASQGINEPDADFLPKPSTPADGDEG